MSDLIVAPETGELVASVNLSLAREPEQVLSEAKRAAVALKDVIARKTRPVVINGETYLEFEDWQTVGRFYGITAKVVSTAPVEFSGVRGFEARAVALYAPTGQELSAADSMCLEDEDRWRGRPLFQIRSMAQTRACAKALRHVLAWVVVLAGYRATPAEELDGVAERSHPPANTLQPPKRQDTTAPPSGSYLVTKVETKDGEGAKGPWRMFRITFNDGKTASTFDAKMGAAAQEYMKAKTPVDRNLQRDGNYNNLVELMPVFISDLSGEAGQ